MLRSRDGVFNIEPPKKVFKIHFAKHPVPTTLEKWAKPGHFSRVLAKGPKNTTWIWNIHADSHDFDVQTGALEVISRKVFSAHFGQLAIIMLWMSGMWVHGARFSNYTAWMENPTGILPSSHLVWPAFGQELFNADLGAGFRGIRITAGWFPLWRACGLTTTGQIYSTAIVGLLLSVVLLGAGWYHYHVASPSLDWFQNAESLLNHHLSGLLGLGCLAWSGHQIHVSLPVNKLLDSGLPVDALPLPQDYFTALNPDTNIRYLDSSLMQLIYPGFRGGIASVFALRWDEFGEFLTFKGGSNPLTGGLWLTDVAHHHLALALLFIVAGHMYRTHWRLGHRIGQILAAHSGPLTGVTNYGLEWLLRNSWHAQLSINLATLGSISILTSHHMYAMPPYPYLGIDYPTQLSLFTHHMWIGGFCIVGAGAHASIYMVRDYSPALTSNNLLDRVLRHRNTIIAHLNWVCIFLGTHSFGLYVHNDTMRALGRQAETFSDGGIQLQPIFAKTIQGIHASAPSSPTAPLVSGPASLVFGGGSISSSAGRISIIPIYLGTSDFMVHHIHAFNIHVTTLILLKGVLFARSSALIPDKWMLGFRFPCDGPGRGGTCQVSGWDHVFLGLFWMYNTISITIFYFSWKMQSDVWGTVNPENGTISHITNGNFSSCGVTINGWLRDYLWSQSSHLMNSYGTSSAPYGLIFLTSHFTWAFSLMFLFSGRGFWQELISNLATVHRKFGLLPRIQPRALSITSGRAVGLAHFLTGGIGTTWAFFLARASAIG